MDLTKQLTDPTENFLLSCCRDYSYFEVTPLPIKQSIELVDWAKFINIANEHGVIALCWNSIHGTVIEKLIPKTELQMIYSGYLKSLARNSQIFSLLDEVVKLASDEKINVILLKGLALENTVYGNKGLRQMNDLDILVKREDAIKLRNILLKKGFSSQPIISPLHEKILPSYGKHLPEMYKNGLSVEIHFKLFDEKGDSLTREFIEHSLYVQITPQPPKGGESPYQTDSLHNSDYRIPSPLYHFLYLVKHLYKHEQTGTSQLRLFADLVWMIDCYKKEILNPGLTDLARRAGLTKALSEKLLLLKEFFDTDLYGFVFPVPENRDAVAERFLMFLRNPKGSQTETPNESLLKPLGEMTQVSHKLLFIIGYLFPSITFMKYRYKVKTMVGAILFYPVRWGKMVKLIVSREL